MISSRAAGICPSPRGAICYTFLECDTHFVVCFLAKRATSSECVHCPETIEQMKILFVFERSGRGAFHMHNVVAPLDIAFVADDGTIVDVQQMLPYADPAKPRYYAPGAPYRYALEARVGFFAEHGLAAGRGRFDVDSLRALSRR